MFLAHANFLKENQHVPVIQYNNEKVLTRTTDGYKLISNICPHQQSLITNKLSEGIRVCPYHNWSFDVVGNPLSSGRTKYYCENKNSLLTEPVYVWNDLLFSNKVDFDYTLDTQNLILAEQRTDIVKATSETIMDLFLDVDHIPIDIDDRLSKVHVFKYKNNNDYNYRVNETVWETAWSQDKTQAELIVRRNTINLETQKQHFRNWQNGSIV